MSINARLGRRATAMFFSVDSQAEAADCYLKEWTTKLPARIAAID
ncbi:MULTISPECIES: hypothetical protein [Mycobacterium]|nr:MULTISPECIES: hypothetical protein [Mycobacterium]